MTFAEKRIVAVSAVVATVTSVAPGFSVYSFPGLSTGFVHIPFLGQDGPAIQGHFGAPVGIPLLFGLRFLLAMTAFLAIAWLYSLPRRRRAGRPRSSRSAE